VFDEPGAAVAWIGVDLDLELLARLEALHAAVYARPEIVWDAWSLLGEHGETPAASAVARALALSPRTLHRRLRAAGTSLRELASAMRVVRAQLEMLQRGDSLEAIALDVGFDSARHFGRVFKRTTGVAPALWREQRRAAAPPPAGSEPLAPGEHAARPGVVYWRATERVHVVMLAGQLRAVACRRFLRLLDRLRSGAHIAIVDVRAVDAVEPEVLQVLRRQRDVLLPAAVEDVVMVAGTSLANVLLTGCGVDLRLPRVTRVTATLAEALAALAVPAGEIAGLEARAALHARAAREGLDDGLSGLRAHLERHLRDATLAATAGALGLSERTLERHLSRRRTSFRRELNRARAVVAKRLLEDAAAPKLAAIAEQVGCSSAQHFTTWFRSYVGVTPHRWRGRRLSPS
jgi:AraC-like DNA-binding protein